MPPPVVLVSALPQTSIEDVRAILGQQGYAVAEHRLGNPAAIDLLPYAAVVICPPERLQIAVEQTRRWRVELGNRYRPIWWLCDLHSVEWHTLALTNGADLVLARPLDAAQIAAQLLASQRILAIVEQQTTLGAEVPVLMDRLHKSYVLQEAQHELLHRVQRQVHTVGPIASDRVRLTVHHRPRSRTGGDGLEIVPHATGWHILLFDTAHGLLNLFLRLLFLRHCQSGGPGHWCQALNAAIRQLDQAETTLSSAALISLHPDSGVVSLARAGLPPVVHVPRTGAANWWALDGPMLGLCEAEYPTRTEVLQPGDRLLLGTDGCVTHNQAMNPDPLQRAAEQHRSLSGQTYVDAVAQEVVRELAPTDDLTLLCLEWVGGS
jgi:DNA-binding response OmpR family regulator